MKMSVIIPNWNGEKFLTQCLDSLAYQTYTDFETIIVDNGSTDSSLDIIARYPWVHVLQQDVNLGFAAAVNIGINASNGKIVAVINNDVILEPDWIQSSIDGMNQNSEYEFAATKVLCMSDLNLIDTAGFELYGAGAVHSYFGILASDEYMNTKHEVFGAVASAALYRRTLLEDIGLYDEDFFAYFEDTDLSFRARLAGYRCIFLPDVVCRHYGSGTGGENSEFYVFHGRRNIEYLYFINMQGFLAWKYFFAHCFYEFLILIAYLKFGLGRTWLRAKKDAIRNIGAIIKKRKKRKELVRVNLKVIDKAFHKGLVKEKIKRYKYIKAKQGNKTGRGEV